MKPRRDTALVSRPASVFLTRPDLKQAVNDYVLASEAKNTIRARKADWTIFLDWCEKHNTTSLPASPEVVAAFISDQSKKDKAVATIVRYARSIHAMHKLAQYESPTQNEAVRLVLRGIRRERGTQQTQKEAMTAQLVVGALNTYEKSIEPGLLLSRNRLVILLGLATAMRRSELCAIDIEDCKKVDGGIIIQLKRSKTDQEGKGRPIAVQRLDEEFARYCPVRALEEWILEIGATTGPLLRGLLRNQKAKPSRLSSQHISMIVKEFAKAGGLDESLFGAHSLRAGFVTTARQQGVDWAAIMEQTGHRRLETAKLYTRYTPDVFVATRVGDIFRGAFKKEGD